MTDPCVRIMHGRRVRPWMNPSDCGPKFLASFSEDERLLKNVFLHGQTDFTDDRVY